MLHIGRKIDINQAIVVDIAQAYASAVIEISVGVNVKILVILQGIAEVNLGLRYRE